MIQMKEQAYCDHCDELFPVSQMVTVDHVGLSVTRLCGTDAMAVVKAVNRQLDAKGLR